MADTSRLTEKAPLFQLIWKSSDEDGDAASLIGPTKAVRSMSPTSTTQTVSNNRLSTEVRVAIGLGVAAGTMGLIGVLVLFITRPRRN